MTTQDGGDSMDWIERQKEEDVLNALRVIGDERNFKILKSAPTTIGKIQKLFGWKPKAANARVNSLIWAGILSRKKGTGQVWATALGLKLISLVEGLKEEAEQLFPRYQEDKQE